MNPAHLLCAALLLGAVACRGVPVQQEEVLVRAPLPVTCGLDLQAQVAPADLEGPVRPLGPVDVFMWIELNARLAGACGTQVGLGVTVRRVPHQPGWVGMTRLRNPAEGFEILVSDSVDGLLLATVLIHEWAHVWAWRTEEPLTPHGPVWGLLFGRCYCIAMETF